MNQREALSENGCGRNLVVLPRGIPVAMSDGIHAASDLPEERDNDLFF